MNNHNFIGCKFPVLFHIPGIMLVINDGYRIQFLDPHCIYNLTLEDTYISFSITRTQASELGWLR